MKSKLTRFAQWLGIINIVDEETDLQKLNRLMFNMASNETWAEYLQLRGTLANINNQAAIDRLAEHVLYEVREKEQNFAK